MAVVIIIKYQRNTGSKFGSSWKNLLNKDDDGSLHE